MAITTLRELYVDQLQDIYSANRQSLEATKKMRDKASESDLKSALDDGVKGIEDGMNKVKNLIEGHDADPTGEHCKGMEGLVREANAHAINADIEDEDVRDASIITQYQRMVHYGVAGYGTAAAFANRLGLKDDAATLGKCLDETREGDRRMNKIAEREVNPAAAA
ncbi:ferritin-like domain-containing protein [Erythrobacter sp.]|uniref:ferritin-like domain-containing protein n=1 Tax=Erythrobacter sp. TaxID=1042 RepID=UPI001425D006|nr:ferritin-like domain-containing protein [Erythrobacter sp.]QIQ87730.1 MAG: ferritin-like domain-containing protein [Erythrobacter sp.]